MPPDDYTPPHPLLATALGGRCPACGGASMFDGYLTLARDCRSCGLDYGFADAGDGPAVFVILFAGMILAGGALLMEVNFRPSYWVHAAVWLPAGIILPLLLLRPFKAMMVALQYRYKVAADRADSP